MEGFGVSKAIVKSTNARQPSGFCTVVTYRSDAIKLRPDAQTTDALGQTARRQGDMNSVQREFTEGLIHNVTKFV